LPSSTWKVGSAEFQRIPNVLSNCRLLALERPSMCFRLALA
jgi:hypothetical protein